MLLKPLCAFAPLRLIKLNIPVLMMVFISPAWAQVPAASHSSSTEMRSAKIYFEAGMFEQARQIYEDLLRQEMPIWQAGVIQYNLGSIYLAQGDLDKAISFFNSLQQTQGLSPYLLQQLNTNLGIAHLRKAIGLNQSSPKERDYPRIIHHLKQSILGFGLALKAECLIGQKVGGLTTCTQSKEIVRLQTQAKILLSDISDQFQEARLSQFSLKQNIPWLFLGMGRMTADLDFLTNTSIDNQLKGQYIHLFAANDAAWEPVWDKIQSEIAAMPDEKKREQSETLAKEGKVYYEQMIAFLKADNLSQSAQAAAKTTQILQELMRLVFEADPLLVLLQNMLSQYTAILDAEELDEATWINLRNQYAALEQLAVQAGGVKQSIDKSRSAFSTGYEAYKAAAYPQARFLLHDAAFWIQDAWLQSQESRPLLILAGLIEQQNLALRLNQLRNQLAEETLTEQIKQSWIDSQQAVLERAAPFLSAVYQQQLAIFRGSGTQRCQASPWNEVLPLFEQGVQAASEALSMLQGKLAQQLQAAGRQEIASAAWKNALNLLLNPKPYQEGSCFGGQAAPQQQKPQEPQESKETPQPKETSSETVLKLLQEMNLDDKLPSTEQAPIKKGLKPW